MKRILALMLAIACAGACVADDSYRERAIEFLKIRSESQDIPNCNRATEYLRNYLSARGVHCTVKRTKEGRDALYAATTPGKAHDYLFVTHIDVVPGPDAMFEPRVEGDRVYARGACDTKLAAWMVAETLVGLVGSGASVAAMFATDEDGCVGEVPTCTMFVKDGFAPRKMIIVADSGGNAAQINIAQKGHWGFTLKMPGKGGHSSVPWKLDNPVPKLARAYVKLLDAYKGTPDDGSHWCNTLEATMLSASDAPNRIPDEASMLFSFRYVGRDDVEDLRRLVKDVTGLEPHTEYCVPPVVNDENDPEIVRLKAAMDAGFPARKFHFGREYGATDAFQYAHLRLPTVIVAMDGYGPHELGEWGSLACIGEYRDFFVRYFKGLVK